MGMLQEFKDFINKGNVLDLAVGVVMGGAFGKIVTSLVEDLINPIIGKVSGGASFSDKFIDLSGTNPATIKAAKESSAAILTYGNFIQNIIQFVIVAFVIFLVVKGYNKMKKPAEAAAPAGPTDVELLAEIRDLLAKK